MKGLDNLLQPVAEGFGGKVEDVFDEGERPHFSLLVPTSILVLLQQTLTQNITCMARKTSDEMRRQNAVGMLTFYPLQEVEQKATKFSLILIIECEEITIFRKHTLLISFKR